MNVEYVPEAVHERKPLRRRKAAVIGAIFLAVLALFFLQRSTLIDPINPGMNFASGAAFFCLGVWLSVRVYDTPSTQSEFSRWVAIIGIPIVAIFIGTYLARAVTGIVSFSGIEASTGEIDGQVVSKRTGTKYGGYYASFAFGPRSREVEARISEDLYYQLEPWREPGRDCLSLMVQTGHGGLRRTILPNLSFDDPIGVDQYKRCER